LLNGHLLLDRPLHSLKTDTELILQQFTDRSDAAVAQVIDVVLYVLLAVFLYAKQVIDNIYKITGREKRVVDAVAFGAAHLDVELQPPNTREIKPASIEEHTFEQAVSGRHRRRIAGAHLAVDLQQRIDRLGYRILFQGLADNFADHIAFWEKHL